MKVLVSTKKTQEFLMLLPVGCKRSMVGVESLKPTTTMKVVDVDITEKELKKIMIKSLKKGGWLLEDINSYVNYLVGVIIQIGGSFETGTILEKRNKTFKERPKKNK